MLTKTLISFSIILINCASIASATAERISTMSPKGNPSQRKITFYVSPNGRENASGTRNDPFPSLKNARDAIRDLKQKGLLSHAKVQVNILDGKYHITEPLVLNEQDSGNEKNPIRYRAMSGNQPVFSGAIPLNNFTRVNDPEILNRVPEQAREHLMFADLEEYGIHDIPPLILRGFARKLHEPPSPILQLIINGQPAQMARWPNEGVTYVSDVTHIEPIDQHGFQGSKFGAIHFDNERPLRWTDEPDGYLHGYWFFGWADSFEKIKKIEPNERIIYFEEPFSRYGYRKGTPYYAVNILAELDAPGEWYLDRSKKRLFLYPPEDIANLEIELAWFQQPFVIMNNVSYVTFEGLTFEAGAHDGIHIENGISCQILGCTIKNLSGNAIHINGGKNHVIKNCEIFNLNKGAIILTGGDRKILEPGNHLVENCHIYNIARLYRTYQPAVLLNGVGHRVAHNLIHHIPSSAFRVNGNNMVIEYNEVHHVVIESDDQGAIDIWGDPTYRGNIFRYNYWHFIGNQLTPHEGPRCGQAAIRLDDAISGQLIYGNLFEHASAGKHGFGAIQIHGGKENVIENNIFLDCMVAITFTPWGENSWKNYLENFLAKANIDWDIYFLHYPELKELETNHDVNYVKDNIILNCEEFTRYYNGRSILSNNIELRLEVPPETKRRFAFLNALLKKNNFAPIPFHQIGMYKCGFNKNKKSPISSQHTFPTIQIFPTILEKQ